MRLQPLLYLTPEQYLAQERQSGTRNEYFNGEIFAMAGASREHNQIAANLVRVLGNQLLEKPCNVYASDMKVKIDKARKYTYPDVVVACQPERFEDEKRDVLLNPAVIIEILSDSTEAYDRGQKFLHYQLLNSLVVYLLVAQDTSRMEIFLRDKDPNSWTYSQFDNLDDNVQIDCIDCTLPVREVYRKVVFKDS